MGDINCDFYSRGNKLTEILEHFNLHQLITEPTRITNESKTLVDYIVVPNNNINIITFLTQRFVSFSDHNLISFKYNIEFIKYSPKMVTKRCYKKC